MVMVTIPGGALHKFLFEGLPVRGMLVRLTDGWQELLKRREAVGPYPPPVRRLLGEMSAAATLMQANIKFNGALVLQVFGDGPVKLAVAEAQPNLGFRATAKVVGDVSSDARLEAMLNVHGKGRCVITLDPKERLPGQQPYQGIVPLHGDRREPLQELSDVLEHYMLQSEQLDTRLVLAADDRVAAGLLIQRLPVEGEGNLGERIGPSDPNPSIASRTLRPRSRETSSSRSMQTPCCAVSSGRKTCAGSMPCIRASRATARASAWARCSRASAARKWTASWPSAATWRSAAISAVCSTTSTRWTWASSSRPIATSRHPPPSCTDRPDQSGAWPVSSMRCAHRNAAAFQLWLGMPIGSRVFP